YPERWVKELPHLYSPRLYHLRQKEASRSPRPPHQGACQEVALTGGGVKRSFIYRNPLGEKADPGMSFSNPLHFKPHPVPQKAPSGAAPDCAHHQEEASGTELLSGTLCCLLRLIRQIRQTALSDTRGWGHVPMQSMRSGMVRWSDLKDFHLLPFSFTAQVRTVIPNGDLSI
ncbi:MAG: hypothetical protein K6T99_10460, partial [Armatimonadetes bacterium]|nr:hypothetical protein [Armatimonadota bacterium]